jgi:hypothetical protein
MTTDRLRELDETPPQPWRETSSAGIRRDCIEQVKAAIRAAKVRGGRA